MCLSFWEHRARQIRLWAWSSDFWPTRACKRANFEKSFEYILSDDFMLQIKRLFFPLVEEFFFIFHIIMLYWSHQLLHGITGKVASLYVIFIGKHKVFRKRFCLYLHNCSCSLFFFALFISLRIAQNHSSKFSVTNSLARQISSQLFALSRCRKAEKKA